MIGLPLGCHCPEVTMVPLFIEQTAFQVSWFQKKKLCTRWPCKAPVSRAEKPFDDLGFGNFK